MMDWLVRRQFRFCWCLFIYFAIHALLRTLLSPSLAYDEAEQVYLTQWVNLGYNSQPPLYTWIQYAIFNTLGTSIFTLALLKNALLLGTYLFIFGFVRVATGDVRAAVVASLGLVTMPQIGYESHRDLSNTIAVMMATAALFFSVVGVARYRSNWCYLAVGLAAAFGMMSKYNFAMTIVAVVLASLTLPNYRKCLLDWRLLIGVLLAAAIVVPHAYWMIQHPGLVSEKTVTQFTEQQTASWFTNVRLGFAALFSVILGCCAASLAIFTICFYKSLLPGRKKLAPAASRYHDDGAIQQETALLLERFLMIIGVMLIVVVMTGSAVEFMNRWLQPFIVVIPAYLTLRFLSVPRIDERAANRLVFVCGTLMVLFTVALVMRPISAGWRERFSWLNMPYRVLADEVRQQIGRDPGLIIANDMRTAGNMRLCFPSAGVISEDNEFLQVDPATTNGPIVLITDAYIEPVCMSMIELTNKWRIDESMVQWNSVELQYVYGQPDQRHEFFVAVVQPPATIAAASKPSAPGGPHKSR